MMHPRLLKAFALVAALTTVGCADAPITASQVEHDGRLRAKDGSVALFSAQSRPAVAEAQPIQVAAVLAGESEGALEDRTAFTEKEDAVHLHLRVDGLSEAWPVSYVWTHDGIPSEVAGQIEPTDTLQMANARELSRGDAGHWKVEVFALLPEGPTLLVEREFDVTRR